MHEFHVWQLAGSKIVASLHLKLPSRGDYMSISESLKNFFHDEGIHSTTIQPEFIEVSILVTKQRDLFLKSISQQGIPLLFRNSKQFISIKQTFRCRSCVAKIKSYGVFSKMQINEPVYLQYPMIVFPGVDDDLCPHPPYLYLHVHTYLYI